MEIIIGGWSYNRQVAILCLHNTY